MKMKMPLTAAACLLALAATAAAQERGTEPWQPQAALVLAETATMDQDQVQTVIEAHGYTNVRDIERNGDQYTAVAERAGEDVVIIVDARTGELTEATN